jgi:hypothetical protein
MNESPVRLPISRFITGGGTLKVKRAGGTGTSNSGGSGRSKRVYTPGRATRNPKNGRHLPWPARGKPIWDPNNDPFIAAYRAAHAQDGATRRAA